MSEAYTPDTEFINEEVRADCRPQQMLFVCDEAAGVADDIWYNLPAYCSVIMAAPTESADPVPDAIVG